MWFSLIVGGISVLLVWRKIRAYEQYAANMRNRETKVAGHG